MPEKALIKMDEFQKEIESFTSFLEILKDSSQEARGELAYMLEKTGTGWALLGDRSIIGLGQICYLAREGWEYFPGDWKENYLNENQENDWKVFARSIAKNKADTTISNYISVYETWFSGLYQFHVPIIYTAKDGTELVEDKPFDPWDSSPSKLLMCCSRAKKGKMRDKDWEALADPETTWSTLQRVLLDKENEDKSKSPRIIFDLQPSGVLTAKRNSETAEMGLLLSPMGDFAEEAFNYLCDLIGVEV